MLLAASLLAATLATNSAQMRADLESERRGVVAAERELSQRRERVAALLEAQLKRAEEEEDAATRAEPEPPLQRWHEYLSYHDGSRSSNERQAFSAAAIDALQRIDVESLPELRPATSVTVAQCAFFRRYGFILLRNVSRREDIEAYRRAIHLAFHSDTEPLARRKTFLRIYNLWRRGAAAARFTLAPRFAQVAAELLGGPVRLYDAHGRTSSAPRRTGDPPRNVVTGTRTRPSSKGRATGRRPRTKI